MATVAFTAQLKRFLDVQGITTQAITLRAALDEAFALNPKLRGYVLDDQGHLRANVVIFVDGVTVRDREGLLTPLAPNSSVYVMQALSGG